LPETTKALKSKYKPEKAVHVGLKKAVKIKKNVDIAKRNQLALMKVGLKWTECFGEGI
jgi:hypothetical protein